MKPVIQELEREQANREVPAFRPGDTLRVHAKVVEGGKERIQVFEGVCLSRKGENTRASFTVRKVSHGVGVERVFLVNSPQVAKIDLVRRAKVRRAKLYYLRGLVGKAARLKELREARG